MNSRAAVGFVCAFLLIASSGAHAFLGWPHFQGALQKASVDPEIVGGLEVGWHFGSVSMLAFGTMVFLSSYRVMQGQFAAAEAIKIIAVAYIVFGVGAFYFKHWKPEFLMFAFIGLLIGWFAFRHPK